MNQRRSPIEQRIAESKDRRVRWEAEQRQRGLVRLTLWVPSAAVEPVRHLIKCLVAFNGRYLADLKALTESWDKPE